MKLKLIKEIN